MALANEFQNLRRVALRHARDAFQSQDHVEQQWRRLNYHAAPDFKRAVDEYERFVAIFQQRGVELVFLPMTPDLCLDAIYVRDASILTPHGLALCNMGKPARQPEPSAAAAAFAAIKTPIAGAIEGEGRLEGGDFIWIDQNTCAVGNGYRTNSEGISQLSKIMGSGIEVIEVALPHYKGPDDVFHLMSFVSPLDRDLMLVYSPVMPVPFRRGLLARGIELVEVPEHEFETMGCNVLALGPRVCLMVEGNPETRRRLEAAGCEVLVYSGEEISRKGEGGPTCLSHPLERRS